MTDRDLLVDSGLVPEETFLRALCAKEEIPFVEPDVALIQRRLLNRTSLPFLKKNLVVPFRVIDGVLSLIMADPLDLELQQEFERIYGKSVQPSCAPSEKILDVLEKLKRLRDGIDSERITTLKYREIREVSEDDEDGEEVIRLVDFLLFKAIKIGASDLHIEPKQSKVFVRVRVDGTLRRLTDLPPEFAERLVSRIKILAGVDIAERRLHQDGRIFVKVDGREIDFRVSTYASMFGETIVLRVLDRNRGLLPLDRLGFEPGIFRQLRDYVLRASSGLILVTGPTGSGKTTTMYSFVDSMIDGTVKAISCEDPVEFVLEGVTQCSVNEKTGPTFADSLRAMLRQDPDIIIVGEIRDMKTASLAVEAALTGHKVLATFHTEDSVTAVVRLLEMGVEPFLVASTLKCILAQRLVRRICPGCRRPADPTRRDLRFLDLSRQEVKNLTLMSGAGCEECGYTGHKGRGGLHELLIPDDDFRDAILRRVSSRELRSMAKKLPGFLTLQEDGLLKATDGVTSLFEVAEHVPRDSSARTLAELQELASRRSKG